MTLHTVGSDKHRLTPDERAELKGPLAELGLTHTKELGGAQVVAAIALDVASSIPGESDRLRAALARYNDQKNDQPN